VVRISAALHALTALLGFFPVFAGAAFHFLSFATLAFGTAVGHVVVLHAGFPVFFLAAGILAGTTLRVVLGSTLVPHAGLSVLVLRGGHLLAASTPGLCLGGRTLTGSCGLPHDIIVRARRNAITLYFIVLSPLEI
jgi:hypothetical protein